MSFDQAMQLCSIVIMPLALLVLGWWYSRHTKKRDDREREEKQAKEEKEQARDQKLDDIKSDISNINVKLERCEKFDEATGRDLKRLESISRMQYQNQSELAQLVMTLAEGLRDQHLDGNITAAVEKYRAYEQKALGSVLSGDVVIGGELETNHLS